MTPTEKLTTVAFWVIIDLVAALVVFEALRYGFLHRDAWSIGCAAVLSVIAAVCTYLGFRSVRRNKKRPNAAA